MTDDFNLNRFLEAQTNIYESVLKELKQGKKETHWMWYIFPQIAGLGYSELSKKYAINSKNEAIAYIKHPILGDRLIECTQILFNNCESSTIPALGEIDSLKFHSSVTLFGCTNIKEVLFNEVIIKLFHGKPDQKTMKLLKQTPLDP